jgi:hypothetical protein
MNARDLYKRSPVHTLSSSMTGAVHILQLLKYIISHKPMTRGELCFWQNMEKYRQKSCCKSCVSNLGVGTFYVGQAIIALHSSHHQ